MPKQKLKLGIIGMGRIAMAHAKSINDLKEKASLVAFSKVRLDGSEEIAEKFGVEHVYSDYRDLLRNPKIDAVIICLPNHLHHLACLDAAKAGKHILVEKPLSMNSDEADDIIQEAEKQHITLMVAQSRRFSAAMKEIFNHLDEIGPPFRIDIAFLVQFAQPPTEWWISSEKAGGLVTLLQGSHSVDTVLWLMKKLPSSVVSYSQSQCNLWQGEDEANMILNYDSGELVSIHLSLNTSPYLHEMLISGPKGSLRLYEYPTANSFGFKYRLDLNDKTILTGEQNPSLYTNQLHEFIDSVQNNRVPIASGLEVRNTMLVLDAVRMSQQERKIVEIVNDQEPFFLSRY